MQAMLWVLRHQNHSLWKVISTVSDIWCVGVLAHVYVFFLSLKTKCLLKFGCQSCHWKLPPSADHRLNCFKRISCLDLKNVHLFFFSKYECKNGRTVIIGILASPHHQQRRLLGAQIRSLRHQVPRSPLPSHRPSKPDELMHLFYWQENRAPGMFCGSCRG